MRSAVVDTKPTSIALAGVAQAASIATGDVSITNIAEVPARRTLPFGGRRSAGSIRVDFSIAVASAEVANTMAKNLRFRERERESTRAR